MSELISEPVEVSPENISFGRRVLKALSKAIGLEMQEELPEYLERSELRGGLMRDSQGNIVGFVDSDGIPH